MRFLLTVLFCSSGLAYSRSSPRLQDAVTTSAQEDAHSDHGYYNRHLEGLLQHKLEKFRDIMRTGYGSLGIGVMDPLFLEDTDMSPVLGGDTFDFQLTQIQVRNLSMFVASEVAADVEESKVLLTFRAPRVTSTMRYRINGALFETFPLVGGGVCDVAYNDVTISAVAQLRGSNGKFQFADFEDPNVDYGSDEVTVQRTGPVAVSGLGSQVGRIIFWTLAKQAYKTLPVNVLRYLNDALERAPRPSAEEFR